MLQWTFGLLSGKNLSEWSLPWGDANMKDDKDEGESEDTTTKLSYCNFLV